MKMADKRLIDANALVYQLLYLGEHKSLPVLTISQIEKAPTVDAVEVVHGNWNIRCETHRDNHTGEVDEDFYLECSECRRKVWDVSQSDVLLGRYGKICNDYPYCLCGAKMVGGAEDGK